MALSNNHAARLSIGVVVLASLAYGVGSVSSTSAQSRDNRKDSTHNQNMKRTVARADRQSKQNLASVVENPLQDEGIYSSIPKDLRPDLIERINLFLNFRRAERWDGLYDLLSENSIRGRTKAQLVEDYTKYPGVAGTSHKLLAFSPKAITAESRARGEWVLSGCAVLRGVKVPVDAFLIASREGNKWRFSDIDMVTPRDTAFVPCGSLAQSSRK